MHNPATDITLCSLLGLRAACGLLTVLLAFGGGPPLPAATPSDTLVVGKAADPHNLDPAVTMDNNDWTVTYPSYQRLVGLVKNTTDVAGDLAQSWQPSKDNLSWTFHLKKGFRFDDGSPADAAAVKFSFDRLMKVAQGPSESFPSDLKCEVVDPLTVKFSMKDVCPYFLSALAINGAAIINPKVIEHAENGEDAKTYLSSHTAGSGAFRLTGWSKAQSLVLEQNPYWPGKKPALKKMVVKIIAEPSSRRLQLESGDLDIIETLPVDQIAEVAKKPNVTVAQNPSMLCYYLYLNCKKPPLNNIALRQAISWAVDYNGIINSIMKGQALQMRGPVPSGMWGGDPSTLQYHTDLAKAKEILAKNNLSNITLGFLYSSRDPNWEPIVLSTQAQLAQVGITVKLESMANTTMRERLNKADFDLSIGVWSPDFADPMMFMNCWFEESRKGLAGNRSWYDNPTVDKMVRDAASMTDQKERTKLYIQAQKIIAAEAPYVYLFQRNSQVAMSKKVKGFIFNPLLEQIFNVDTITKE